MLIPPQKLQVEVEVGLCIDTEEEALLEPLLDAESQVKGVFGLLVCREDFHDSCRNGS